MASSLITTASLLTDFVGGIKLHIPNLTSFRLLAFDIEIVSPRTHGNPLGSSSSGIPSRTPQGKKLSRVY